MKRFVIAATAGILCLCGIIAFGKNTSAAEQAGEALFNKNCAVCHVNGGNIINPQKTLHKKDREANHIRNANDIVKRMRNPGPGMTKFDEKTIPNKEAHEIAEYVLKTFN